MRRRRSLFDRLATADQPRWLVVKDMHSAVLDSVMIPAGTDLHGLMADTISSRTADGWTVENDGSYGFVFCHEAGVRRMVAIVQVDPAQPVSGAYPPRSNPQPARMSS